MSFDTNIIISVLDPNGDREIYELVSKYIVNKTASISVIVYSEVLAFPKLTAEEKENIKLYLTNNFIIDDVNINICEIASEIVIKKRLETGKKLKLNLCYN